MPDQPQLIYLEPDDEITSVVRRLRAAEGKSVVIVAPGRSRATSSAVALRLLAAVAAEEKRTLSLVADAPTRAVAGEAGIAAFASVAEATSGSSAPDQAAASPRAPIHVVRGLPEGVAAVPGDVALAPAPRSSASDETMAVRLPPPAARGTSGRSRRRSLHPRWPWLVGLLLVALAAGAAVLPGATVSVTPATQAVGPKAYQLQLLIVGRQSSDLRVTRPGTATGQRIEKVAATGTVTFYNWNTVTVEISQGTQVSVGGTIAFITTERIVVPRGHFQPRAPGKKSVGVVAVEPGTGGNVAAGAIDTVDDVSVRDFLRGLPDNPNGLVSNLEPTAGGLETPHSVIQQSDVDALVAAIKADLAPQLAAALAGQPDRLYAGPPATEVPEITIPPGLVGTEDMPTFELTGLLSFDRPYVTRADVETAARAALLGDATAPPTGTTVLPDSITTEIGNAAAKGSEMTIAVSVRAAAAAAIDVAAVRDRVAGMTRAEAQAALAGMGQVEINLWPGWLDRLPRLAFRISVQTVARAPGASPSP